MHILLQMFLCCLNIMVIKLLPAKWTVEEG